jgi:four helix bundle suffix protein
VEVAKESGHCGQNGQCGQNLENPPLSTGSTESTRSTRSTLSTLSTTTYPELSANATLVLLTVACSLLDRQVERLAQDFEKEGGFTERLYKVRTAKRRSAP